MASHFLTPLLLRRNNTLLVGTGARRKGRPSYFRGSAIKKKVLFGGFNGGIAAQGFGVNLARAIPLVEPPSANYTIEIDRVRLVKNISLTYACGVNSDASLSGTSNTVFIGVGLLRDGYISSDSAATIDSGSTVYSTFPINNATITPATPPTVSFIRPEQDIVFWDLYSFGVNDCGPRHITSPMEIQLMRGDILYLFAVIFENTLATADRSDAVLGTGTAIHPDINFCYECEELM